MRPEITDAYGNATGREVARRPGWFSKLLPAPVVRRSLSVSLVAPDEFVVGEPQRFALRVKNRLPAPVAVSLPTSRVWGWRIDGYEEADDRPIDPPTQRRVVAFANRETRTFVGQWDGHLRRSSSDGDRWEPVPGNRTLSAYLATDPPVEAETTVVVRTG